MKAPIADLYRFQQALEPWFYEIAEVEDGKVKIDYALKA